MAARRTHLLSAAVVLVALWASPAAADELGLGFVTCITPDARACPEFNDGTPVWWRVVPIPLNSYASSFPGSNDLLDVSLQFDYEGGSSTYHWDLIGANFVETPPFDVALVKKLTSLEIDATLARTVFDPVFPFQGSPTFVADSSHVSVSQTSFPPPLDFFATGTFIPAPPTPVPEPTSLVLVGTGIAGVLYRSRRRRP
jgi:hypothetical protein